ncbi:MAG: hypothetical protein KGH58_00350 [Candidatus Micrarchaeota archaeon]|nr:hypothetical protein [Candidatus Micrarchaeota archaeon]
MSRIYKFASGAHSALLEEILSWENSFFRGLGWLVLHAAYLLIALLFALAFFVDWFIPAAIVAVCVAFEIACWIGDKIVTKPRSS